MLTLGGAGGRSKNHYFDRTMGFLTPFASYLVLKTKRKPKPAWRIRCEACLEVQNLTETMVISRNPW